MAILAGQGLGKIRQDKMNAYGTSRHNRPVILGQRGHDQRQGNPSGYVLPICPHLGSRNIVLLVSSFLFGRAST